MGIPSPFARRALLSVAAAAAAVLLGLLSRWVVARTTGVYLIYLPFFPWLIAASLVAGFSSGFLSVIAFSVIGALALEPTTLIPTPSPLVGLIVFSSFGFAMSALGGWACAVRQRNARARLALRLSEERLRVALEAGNMGTWEWTLATGRIAWSPGLEAIHGRPPGSFKGAFDDVVADVHPADRDRFVAAVRQALDARAEHHIEYRIIRHDAAERWIEARGRVICSPAGAPLRMVGVCMDVSDRRRAEEAVRGSERQMRIITDALPALMAYVDADERYVFVSRAYEIWLARPRGQIVGRTIRELAPSPETYSAIKPRIDSALAGHAESFHIATRYPDGVLRDVDATYSPDIGPDGDVRGFAVLAVDITQERQALRQLADANLHIAALTEAVPDFVWSCAADGRIEYVNQRYVAYTGATVERINAGGWHEVVHPDDWAAVGAAWADSLSTGHPFELEYRMRRRDDGGFRWFLSRTVPVRDDEGRLLRWVGAATDIHETKLAREERERLLAAERAAREEAERAGRIKDQFLAVLSHELRTPLTPVLLTVSLLESSRDLPPALRDDIVSIRRSVELEARLIDDLLDLTRIARGKIGYEFHTVDVHLLLRAAISICCHDGKHEVHVDFAPRPALVDGDSARLQQVFWNLLNNAWKFTPAGGRVCVRTTVADNLVRIEISDNGVGIEPAVLPRVFDAFEQGDPTRARRFGGLGLGLAITKALLTAHHGAIEACSDGPGRGSCFIIALPAVAGRAPDDRPPSAAPLPSIAPAPRMRMLLVEDHPTTLRALTKLLIAIGHDVEPAASVAEGLRAAAAGRYDLVISDIGLPDGTGFDLMRQLRAAHGLRGIALSGYGMEEDIARSRDAGFIEHLVKPVDLQKLRDTIARVAAAEPAPPHP